MKKQILTLIAFAGTALAGMSPVEVKVPFAFTARTVSMPAGTYTLEDVGATCVLIRGEGKGVFMLDKVGTMNNDPAARISLKFGKRAAGYVLESIQPATEEQAVLK